MCRPGKLVIVSRDIRLKGDPSFATGPSPGRNACISKNSRFAGAQCGAIHTSSENRWPRRDGTRGSLKRLTLIRKAHCLWRAEIATAKILLGGGLLALQGDHPGIDHRAVEDLVHRPDCAFRDGCDVHDSSLMSMATCMRVGFCRPTDCAASHTGGSTSLAVP
jgi:hypothetical protein